MNENKSTIQSWLDKLQQDSWQLELIISSILLFIINSFDDKVPDLIMKYQSSEGFNFAFVVAIIVPILLFLKSNLIVHIFLRGLWIGCIGLRSISTDIRYESFDYGHKFDRFLKNNVGSFDDYIQKLESICSIIFSYSFLMAFHFFSFSFFITIFQSLNFFGWQILNNSILEPVLNILLIVLTISAILNFIDFLTIGELKKAKKFSSVYYPFYKIYNTLSLSFLYRPIHYNFISTKLGRTYMLLMLPYMFLLAFVGNAIDYKKYIYIPKKEDRSNWVIENYYDSLRDKSLIKDASINKLFFEENETIKLFLRVNDNEKTNALIKSLCPEITSYDRQPYTIRPFNTLRVSTNDDYYEKVSPEIHRSKVETSIDCISKMYEIAIDDNILDALDYVFYQHPNASEKGILTGININNLPKGKHTLSIYIKTSKEKNLKKDKIIEIPFFKN